ncbi:MAG TPA: MFS transporter [Sediminibacterium sp.]|uniref:MFS transporter n=1 Tax=Sediminibacterium sp. TaxID=1917865 RepID=UPI0008CE3957|nr:MFS transporter [Sediminibacterium sp.]OHC86396.1 MAG: MFS transporter [Sphingobacteriia bacterium RIFOXYC2_FULL_35_18]OHC89909.1 MAG: MFS transporter [Sphingobacteriia bacterium RIFOXYD2_FULL_35_12]HLD54184.1 MFS transporter [Sediminibacterium sp.]
MNKTKGTSITSVISASSVGTMIEWYDFYIFGSLATIISTKFFPQDNPTAAFLSTLATFAAGFVVRPFGALFFGRLGDLIGRKYTFMVTLLLMGGATFLIGCIPSYETIGFMAPVLILLLRLLQGLALGGEYGGAATYVAEHSPEGKRGFMTAWIQTTATVGLFVSLLVIMGTRAALSAEDFDAWGWRVPFWVSILMVLVSYLIRKNMEESPVFAKAKAAGKTSTNPLKESFGKKLNFKFVLLALFGAVMGQGVIWYTGQFYAMSFIEKTMNVDKEQVDSLMFIALMLGTPFFLVFGWLSDKIGRKWIMMAGMLIAIVSYRPIYENMYQTTNVANKIELSSSNSMVNNVNTVTTVYADSTIQQEIQKTNPTNGAITTTIKISINSNDKQKLILLVFIQVLFVTMVYGPIAAFLVEMFPTKIRYTSMSLPYHIGNGVFGGLLPAVATYFATNAKTAGKTDWYLEGLWYPIGVAAVCLVIGVIYINGKDKEIND